VAVAVIDDVLPALDGQLDASAVGIDDLGEDRHGRVWVMGDVQLDAG
jgi:hypothetical protein